VKDERFGLVPRFEKGRASTELSSPDHFLCINQPKIFKMSKDLNDRVGRAHAFYMRLALSEARKSPPEPSNFCVGACVVAPTRAIKEDVDASDEELERCVLTTGYTLECEGNTHAEQCCFIKLAAQHVCSVEEVGSFLPEKSELYTTMEPCNKRSVGNLPCVDRILQLKRKEGRQAIETVYVGVSEPEKFVGVNEGRKRLEDAGISVVHVPGFEKDILSVATAGHEKT
jgi:pyrimidine deaminase RibD-like protein